MNNLQDLSVGVGVTPKPYNAFSNLAGKLREGSNGVIFINSDSTGHAATYSVFYKMGVAIGDIFGCTVNLYRWQEYTDGTLDYETVDVIRSGSAQTLTIYLAAMPGEVAGCFFDGTRKPTAIDAIPTPDIAIMHHGHNMANFAVPTAGLYGIGAGTLLGPIGMTSLQWPGVPQVMTNQNPWQNGTGYSNMKAANDMAHSGLVGVTLVDTYTPFITAGKPTSLYRTSDYIHPSDTVGNSTGAQLMCDTIMEVFTGAKRARGYAPTSWTNQSGTDLLANGDFSTWSSTFPTGWATWAGGAVAKDFVNTYGGASYSLSLTPEGGQTAGMVRVFTTGEKNAVLGKTISVAVLMKGNATQRNFYMTMYAQVNGGRRTISQGQYFNCKDGWMWLVIQGVQLDATTETGDPSIIIFPAFNVSAPENNNPLIVQRMHVVEGLFPMGFLS